MHFKVKNVNYEGKKKKKRNKPYKKNKGRINAIKQDEWRFEDDLSEN